MKAAMYIFHFRSPPRFENAHPNVLSTGAMREAGARFCNKPVP